MKRSRIGLAVLVLAAVLFGGLLGWLSMDPDRPQFRKVPQGFQVGAYDRLSYHFLDSRPFKAGRMWLWVGRGTNGFHSYLFDIERRSVLGELHNAAPIFSNSDGLLCMRRRGAQSRTLLLRLTSFLEWISGGRFQISWSSDDVETVWIVSLTRNSATCLGHLSQYPGAGSSFVPSPDLRYGYNKPSGSFQKSEFYLCDLQRRTLNAIAFDGWPAGWWDKSHIIIKKPNHDFILYDIRTGTTTNFLPASSLIQFRAREQLGGFELGKANLFWVVAGERDVFYLTDTHSRWLAEESYLARLDGPQPALKLITNQFKFEWSDHFDPDGTYYLYSGRESGYASSAVFLRDLRNGSTVTIVPDDGLPISVCHNSMARALSTFGATPCGKSIFQVPTVSSYSRRPK